MPDTLELTLFALVAALYCGGLFWFWCWIAERAQEAHRSILYIAFVLSGLLMALVLLGVIARLGPLPGEESLRAAMDRVTDSTPLVLVVTYIGRVDRLRLWLLFDLAIAFSLFWQGARRASAVVLAGAALTEALTATLLVVVERARPGAVHVLQSVPDALSSGSFPPGPVARTFVAVGMGLLIWSRLDRRWFAPGFAAAIIVVALTGVAQVVGVEHWPTDVLGGYLEGGICLGVVALALAPLTQRRTRKASSEKRAIHPPA